MCYILLLGYWLPEQRCIELGQTAVHSGLCLGIVELIVDSFETLSSDQFNLDLWLIMNNGQIVFSQSASGREFSCQRNVCSHN